MDRRYWIGILIVIALGAIIFALAQNQTLNQTQSTLVAAQSTVTAQFDQMNGQSTAAVETLAAAGTQSADAQQKAVMDAQSAAATALSVAVSDAQGTAAAAQSDALKQAQDIYTTAQAQAVTAAENAAATAQSAAVETVRQDADATLNAVSTADAQAFATAQALAENNAATLQANADAQAQALGTAQAQAQDAATAQAQALGTAQTEARDAATAQAQAREAATAQVGVVGTAQAQARDAATAQAQAEGQIQALNATIAALEGQVGSSQAQLTPPATPSLPPEVAGGVTPAPGWKRILGRGVAIQLPDSFDGLDLATMNTDAIASALHNMGPEFDSAAALIRQNPDLFVLMAFDNRSKSGLVSNVLILAQDLPMALPLKSIVDATVAQLPASIHVTDNSIIQVGSRQAGRIVTESALTSPASNQMEYFFIDNGRVYVVVFTTSVDEFEARRPVFEQAVETLEFLTGN